MQQRQSVILSLLNQLFFLLLVTCLDLAKPILPQSLTSMILSLSGSRLPFFFETLVFPSLLGLILGVSLRRGWNERLLGSLAMPVIHPTRRAYDFAFGDIKTERFLIVTFADGTVVYGFFGANSLASSDPANGDIYIERLYDVRDGVWQPTEPPKSALLMLRDLRTIEFI